MFVGQACDWLRTPALTWCEATGERWAGHEGQGRGAGDQGRAGGGGGRGLAPAMAVTGGREKRNRGHEDTRTTDQSQSAKRLERAED